MYTNYDFSMLHGSSIEIFNKAFEHKDCVHIDWLVGDGYNVVTILIYLN